MVKQSKSEIQATFFAGLLTLLPLAIMIAFFVWLFNLLIGIVRPILVVVGLNYNFFLVLVVLVVLFLLIYLTGMMIRTRGGRYAFHQLEQLLLRLVPGYKQVKGMVESFTGKSSSKSYKSVVLVDVFQNGSLMTGFVTDRPTKDICTVFVPTGPNPTTGMIYHVSKKFVTEVDIAPQKAFESIIAVGKNSKAVFDAVSKKK